MKQDKFCKFSKKASISSYVQQYNRKQLNQLILCLFDARRLAGGKGHKTAWREKETGVQFLFLCSLKTSLCFVYSYFFVVPKYQILPWSWFWHLQRSEKFPVSGPPPPPIQIFLLCHTASCRAVSVLGEALSLTSVSDVCVCVLVPSGFEVLLPTNANPDHLSFLFQVVHPGNLGSRPLWKLWSNRLL